MSKALPFSGWAVPRRMSQARAYAGFAANTSTYASSNFFNHILRLPVSYFSQRYAGEIGSRVMMGLMETAKAKGLSQIQARLSGLP